MDCTSLANFILGTVKNVARQAGRLIGVGNAALLDAEQVNNIPLGNFRNRNDVVRFLGDAPDLLQELFLVIERRIGQPQRHEIVDRIKIGSVLECYSQRIGPVRNIGCTWIIDVQKLAIGSEMPAGDCVEITRVEDPVMHRKPASGGSCDDFSGYRNLPCGGAHWRGDKALDNLLGLHRLYRGIKEADLCQKLVFAGR